MTMIFAVFSPFSLCHNAALYALYCPMETNCFELELYLTIIIRLSSYMLVNNSSINNSIIVIVDVIGKIVLVILVIVVIVVIVMIILIITIMH